MVRLTAEVLLQAENYLNACQDREINLRGLKIPTIENLAVLQDQYDVIDLSDNDIKKVDHFPVMRRLSCLLLCNNSVSRIATDLGSHLPKLSAVILTNNRISNLFEIDHLSLVTTLEVVSLLENPVVLRPNYRLYSIFRIPSLKCLDFCKVTRQEREEAARFFKSSAGKTFLQQVALEQQQQQQATAPIPPPPTAPSAPNLPGRRKAVQELTEAQKAQVKRAIENATTREEVDMIERQLQTGTFPFRSDENETENAQTEDRPSAPLPKAAALITTVDMDID